MTGFDVNAANQFGRIVKSDKFDKVKFAELATDKWGDDWPFDLKARCEELVQKIKAAR